MKRIIFAVLFGVASLTSISTKAQVSVNINIGSQPQWGPTGYDHVDYYYLPDVDAYYYVPTSQFIYLINGTWAWRNSLPARYSGYDLYNGYKVVMNSRRPYLSHNSHIQQYGKYKNYGGRQSNIRNSKDVKYENARNNKPTTVHNTNKTIVKVGNNNGRNNQGNKNQGSNRGTQNNNRPTTGKGSNNDSKGNGNQGGRPEGRAGRN